MNNLIDDITGRILGLDYGHRRIGVARSDPLRITAQSLPTIKVQNIANALSEIEQLVAQYDIKQIVVGMPFTMKGGKSAKTKETETFIRQLRQRLAIPIIEWDERLTTVAAHRTLHELNKSPSKNKARIDQISALLILQTYLDYIRK